MLYQFLEHFGVKINFKAILMTLKEAALILNRNEKLGKFFF